MIKNLFFAKKQQEIKKRFCHKLIKIIAQIQPERFY